MPQVTGEVEAKSGRGDSIKVGGEWYSSYKGFGLAEVVKGTTVDFQWNPDKTGRYKNIDQKSLRILGAPSGLRIEKTAGGVKYTPPSNIGVELGHASKLAMDMTLASTRPDEVGSDNFYKFWILHTEKIYSVMGRLRKAKIAELEKAANPAFEVPILAKEEVKPFMTKSEESDLSGIFE